MSHDGKVEAAALRIEALLERGEEMAQRLARTLEGLQEATAAVAKLGDTAAMAERLQRAVEATAAAEGERSAALAAAIDACVEKMDPMRVAAGQAHQVAEILRSGTQSMPEILDVQAMARDAALRHAALTEELVEVLKAAGRDEIRSARAMQFLEAADG